MMIDGNVLSQTLVALLSLVTTWILTQLSSYLKSKTEAVKQANSHKSLDKYLELAVNVVLDTVRATNQTVVRDLRAAAEDGRLTAEEKEEVLTNATEVIITSLSENAKEVLSMAFGDLDTWIKVQIENAVVHEKVVKSLTDGTKNNSV